MVGRFVMAVGLVVTICGFGEAAEARAPSHSEEGDKAVAVERLIHDEMRSRGIPGLQLAIVRNRRIVFTGAYGHAQVSKSIPVTARTVFPINSMSKAFAGVAVMQLVEAGRLDLDASIAKYLKGLEPSWATVTVRQVLTHTSGLPEIIDDNVKLIDGDKPDVAWAKVQKISLRSEPGTRFAYTQTNYVVIGKIIEALTGKSFSDFVRDRQFRTAGMSQTGFGDSADVTSPVASTYTFLQLLTNGTKTVGVERSNTLLPRHEPWPDYMLPAAGIQSNATELAWWVIALQAHKLLNMASLDQLWTPLPLKDGTYGGFGSTINGYALGWPAARRPDHPAMTPVGGERAAMFIYPEDDLTVIVLTNLMGASPQTFVDRIAAPYLIARR